MDDEDDAGKLFDSNAIIPNQYYSLTFDEEDEFPYCCLHRPSMVREVLVFKNLAYSQSEDEADNGQQQNEDDE